MARHDRVAVRGGSSSISVLLESYRPAHSGPSTSLTMKDHAYGIDPWCGRRLGFCRSLSSATCQGEFNSRLRVSRDTGFIARAQLRKMASQHRSIPPVTEREIPQAGKVLHLRRERMVASGSLTYATVDANWHRDLCGSEYSISCECEVICSPLIEKRLNFTVFVIRSHDSCNAVEVKPPSAIVDNRSRRIGHLVQTPLRWDPASDS